MPTQQPETKNSSYLFADDESNSARLIELRDILAEDPDLASVSDTNEFRAELAALEAHAAAKESAATPSVTSPQSTSTSRQIVVVLENSAGCQLDRVVITPPDSDDPGETLNLAIHEAIERWVISTGDIIRVSEAQSVAGNVTGRDTHA